MCNGDRRRHHLGHLVLEGNINRFISFAGALEKQCLHGHLRKVTGMKDGCEEYSLAQAVVSEIYASNNGIDGFMASGQSLT